MADTYYQSVHTGKQIDNAISRIASGEFDILANEAIEAANVATNAAGNASVSEANAANSKNAAAASAEKAQQTLNAMGDDAQIAKQAATEAKNSAEKAKLYADQTEASVSGVASFNGRGGHVVPQTGDYTADMVGAVPLAPVALYAGEADVLSLAPGRYTIDGVSSVEQAMAMNLPESGWHWEIEVLAAVNKDDAVHNIKIIFAYRQDGAMWMNSIPYSDSGAANGWKRIATTDTALMRDGRNAMTGALKIEGGNPTAIFNSTYYPSTIGEVGAYGTGVRLTNRKQGGTYNSLVVDDPDSSLDEALKLLYQDKALYNILHSGNIGDYAAPAGFGEGSVEAKLLTSADDLNTIKESGLYYWHTSVPQNALSGYGNLNQYVLMEVASAWNGYTTQRFRSLNAQGVAWRREHLTYPYEFENPPMQLNTEYRTTERYLGKPVYAKLVYFGALPSAATGYVEHGIVNIERVVFVFAEAKYPNATAISLIGNGYIDYVDVTEGSLSIKTNIDLSGYTAHVLMKYTKTTD